MLLRKKSQLWTFSFPFSLCFCHLVFVSHMLQFWVTYLERDLAPAWRTTHFTRQAWIWTPAIPHCNTIQTYCFWDMKVDILTLIWNYNMATFVTSLYFLCMIISEIGDSEKKSPFSITHYFYPYNFFSARLSQTNQITNV